MKKIRFISGIVISFVVAVVGVVYFLYDMPVVAVGNQGMQPIYNGNRSSNKVALTFNCYEGSEYIYEISNELKKYGFKATFFFGGCFADDNIELIKFLIEEGHEIGNHGYFHKEHDKLNYDANRLEIKNTHDMILAQTGVEMRLFAPPSGAFSKTTLEVCEKMGYKVILWSIDTIDWRDKSEKIVYNRATKNIRGGDFVLMHPKEHTLKALPKILQTYLNCGLVVTTVSQCMENNG